MSIVSQVEDLAVRIGTQFGLVSGRIGDLASLATTNKTNLVAAINEIKNSTSSAAGINDGVTSTTSTWSSQKVQTAVSAAVSNLVATAPTTLDTLKELADALGGDANFAATISTALGNRLRVDTGAQGLSALQQGNARTNIGAASASDLGDVSGFDPVATFEASL